MALMPPVMVSGPKHCTKDGKSAVSAWISIGANSCEVWYRVSEGPLSAEVEPFLAATLLPAMKVGAPLKLPGAVSSRLLGAIPRIQEVFHIWDRNFRKTPVEAEPKNTPGSTGARGVACFFSGGVDSFYSVLKHREEIAKLILVYGFDIRLDDEALRAKVSKAAREAAAELHKPLVEVETNVRELSDQHVSWQLYHGAALASVALLLSPQFRKVYIAATHTYAHLFPWGSHPLLDPLWSTEETEIVHDGSETTRVEKVGQIVSCATARKYLRVCWKNLDGAYNCGRCEKCLRTMIALYLAGALERCATFDRPFDLAAISRIEIPNANARAFVEETLEAVERFGQNPALARALRNCLGRYAPGIRGVVQSAVNRLSRLIGPSSQPL